MKSTHQSIVHVPVELIDLPAWIEGLSDRDYQACSPAHIAAGVFREDGVLGSVNVESVGGHLLVHHYLAAEATPRRIVMHTLPATIEVIWTLEASRKDSGRSLFRCTVEVNIAPVLGVLATLALLPRFLSRHVEAETPLFAADLARKVAGGRLARPRQAVPTAGVTA